VRVGVPACACDAAGEEASESGPVCCGGAEEDLIGKAGDSSLFGLIRTERSCVSHAHASTPTRTCGDTRQGDRTGAGRYRTGGEDRGRETQDRGAGHPAAPGRVHSP
jgi:hypothetical protein